MICIFTLILYIILSFYQLVDIFLVIDLNFYKISHPIMLPEGMPLPEQPEIYSPKQITSVLDSIENNLKLNHCPDNAIRLRELFDEIFWHTRSTNDWPEDIKKRFAILFGDFSRKYPASDMPPRKPEKNDIEEKYSPPTIKPKKSKFKPPPDPKPKPPKPPKPKPKKPRKSRDDVNCNHIPGYLDILSGKLHERVMVECKFDTLSCESVAGALQEIAELKKSLKSDPAKLSRETAEVIRFIRAKGKFEGREIQTIIQEQLRIILIGDGLIIAEED